MDQQKTGTLIADRRRQLGLTQKQLAEKLDISDRTVSKWERGAGFPDISLMEPLADALNLTVLELLHGQQEVTLPEQENSARETLQAIGPQVNRKLSRSRRWIIALTVLVIILIIAIPWLAESATSKFIASYEITSAEATGITPMILITSQDYDLIEALLRNDKLQQHYETHSIVHGDLITINLDEDEAAHYMKLIDMGDVDPEFLIVQVDHDLVDVTYGTDYICVYLNYRYGEMDKTVVIHEYPYRKDGKDIPMGQRQGSWTGVSNSQNEYFEQYGRKTGWLEFFRTTYY